MNQSFLIFSGHNDRAVIALCRYFTQSEIDFCIISCGTHDIIYRTKYANRVVFQRSDTSISRETFEKSIKVRGSTLIYCPTTEFINTLLLENKIDLHGFNIEVNLPPKEIYFKLTSKLLSQSIVKYLQGLELPQKSDPREATAPCVLKPIVNIHNGRGLYPILCSSQEDIDKAFESIDPNMYFAQEHIDGKSFYLCGYVDKDGNNTFYWQENLLQQPNGKSIVLAREAENPGFNELQLFFLLHKYGYYGPIMMEIIVKDQEMYFIEFNPRFWGPLQLAVDCCPGMLDMFVVDNGACVKRKINRANHTPAYYAWRDGAFQVNLRNYSSEDHVFLNHLLIENDVFSKDDFLY